MREEADAVGSQSVPSMEPALEGGDAACWLAEVCQRCGALNEVQGLPCWRCGADARR
jgi:hypothetical protein